MKYTISATSCILRPVACVGAALLMLGSGCAAGDAPLEGADIEVVDSFGSTQDMKADGASTVQNWSVYEQAGQDGLASRDQFGDVLFNAQIEQVDGSALTIHFQAPAACSVQLDVATGLLHSTDCSGEDAAQIADSLMPLFQDATQAGVLQSADGKGDGFIVKSACVVGGIGVVGFGAVAVLAAGMAAAPVGLVASYGWGSIAAYMGGFGSTAALCYEAFAGSSEPELTECVDDCDEGTTCISACIDTSAADLDALPESERANHSIALLSQCVRGCGDDATGCIAQCVDAFTPAP